MIWKNIISKEIFKQSGYFAPEVTAAIKMDANENPFTIQEPLKRKLLERMSRIDFNRYPVAGAPELRDRYAIISGEGTTGNIDVVVTGHRGIMARLRRETCGGDRWAWAVEMLPGETPSDAIGRGRSIGPRIDACEAGNE